MEFIILYCDVREASSWKCKVLASVKIHRKITEDKVLVFVILREKSKSLILVMLITAMSGCQDISGYDFRIWGQRFFPFFQHGSMPKRFKNMILPLYSGADEAFSRNSNTNTFTPQHQIPRLRQIQPH